MNLYIKIIMCYILFINLLGFLFFGIDKYKAKHNLWRIKEHTLFLIAGIGGSIGCILGMKFFHHKTLHNSFRFGLPAIFISHIVLIAACAFLYFKYL